MSSESDVTIKFTPFCMFVLSATFPFWQLTLTSVYGLKKTQRNECGCLKVIGLEKLTHIMTYVQNDHVTELTSYG